MRLSLKYLEKVYQDPMEARATPLALPMLEGRRVGEYKIHLLMKELAHRQGWTHFSVFLADRQGRLNQQTLKDGRWVNLPVLEGIHSRGGREVKGWIEIGDYFASVFFPRERASPVILDLASQGLDQRIMNCLSEAVPPGGHLMFAYEVSYESPLHRETQVALTKGVPPVCTPHGAPLFRAGFRLVKDFYLAEGGHEGPRKLWGEKPSDEAESIEFDTRMFVQLLAFLSTPPAFDHRELEMSARNWAYGILNQIRLEPRLSRLRDEVIHIYEGGLGLEALRQAAAQTCEFIIQIMQGDDFAGRYVHKRLADIAKRCPGHHRNRSSKSDEERVPEN